MRRVDLGRLDADLLPLLQQAATEARPGFNALIDSLYPADGDPAVLLSGVLSRSPFVGALFLDCVRLRLVEKLLEGEGVSEVVVDSATLGEVLAAAFREHETPARVVLAQSAGERARRFFRPFVRAAKAALRFAREGAAASGRRLPPGLPPLTLLDAFLLRGSFSDGKHRDRYYPGLLDALTPAERETVYFLPEIPEGEDAPGLVRAAAASGGRFLFKGAYLTAWDYLAAWLSPLRSFGLAAGPRKFGRFDVAPLVRAEAWETAWNAMSLGGYLNLRFAHRLKEAGVKVRFLLDWSENQLIDRGLVLGFRSAYPGLPVVGYCGYVIAPEKHPYARPTARERAAGLVPDALAVVGPSLVEPAKEFDPALPVETAPAFRFAGVWRKRHAEPDAETKTILLALPISVEGAVDAMALAADAGLDGVRVAVKAHPAVPEAALRAAFAATGRAWPAAFEFVHGDFADRVERADLLAGSVSSTCVEALASGVPVVIVGNPRGLTEDPIPAGLAPEMRSVAFTPAEFKRCVEELLTKDPARRARYAEIGRGVRQACFTPVDEAGVRRLLRL